PSARAWHCDTKDTTGFWRIKAILFRTAAKCTTIIKRGFYKPSLLAFRNMNAEKRLADESKGFYKLSQVQRIGFGSGDLAQNLIYQTVSMYLLIFYTNVFGISAAAAGVMFLVVRIVDVIWDPIVGAFVDKSNPKMGKYRSYLVLGGIPLTGFAILCFWNGFSGSLVYAYVTYVGLSMLYTLINVPYGALNASLTRDTDEITKLTSARMFMANLGGLAVGYGVPIVVQCLS